MKRKIVKINENICNGCGLCVEGCHEGALQLIDGKARIINEVFCDGLGTCIGECPVGAIKIEERGAMPYDEITVMKESSQWPVQLRLLNPQSSFFKNADVVLAADCSAYAYGDFHNRFLKNNSIAIACPKLDNGKEEYMEKITAMVELSEINTLTVVIMEVPCCEGLTQLALQAVSKANRKIPVKKIVIGIKGNIVKEDICYEVCTHKHNCP